MMTALPRISFDELPKELQALLAGKHERLGYLGDFFQFTAAVPELLIPFVRFSEAAKEALPQKVVEVVALTVARVTQNPYEESQHERLCLNLGYPREWISAVQSLNPNKLDEPHKTVQRFVLAAIPPCDVQSTEVLESLIMLVGSTDALGVMFLTGRYVAHSSMCTVLGLRAPVASIHEHGEPHG